MGKVKNRNVLSKVQKFFMPRSSTSCSVTALLTPSISTEKQSTSELHLEKSSATKTLKSGL